MAYLVLYLIAQFGKGLVVAVGTEDGIVAEAPYPTPFAGYLAFDDTLKEVDALHTVEIAYFLY